MTEALQGARAVDGRGLVQLGGDGAQARQERDAEEGKAAPDVDADHRGHGRARLAEPPHALGQEVEDLDQEIVQHAEAVVEDPQKIQGRDHRGRHPRNQEHARPEAAETDSRGQDQGHQHAEDELHAHGAEGEDEAVDDGALEEAVEGDLDVVVEAHEDGRHPHVLPRHAQVDRVAEGIGDEREHQHHGGQDEEIAEPVVRAQHAGEADERPRALRAEGGLGSELGGADAHGSDAD